MRDIILKLNPVTQNLTKLTATNPIKGSQANDVYYLYAPYGSNAALIKFLPQKFFNTNGTNPVPAIKMTQETDIEVIAAKIPEGDLEDSWSLYYLRVDYGISAILQSQQASQYKVGFTELDVDLDDEEYIGEYATASEVDATINAELKVEFASATTDDFVNVYKTTSNDYTSWLFDGTDWADQDELLNLQVAANTNVFTETFKQAVFSNDDFNMGTPEAQAQVLNQIYAELANLNALVEALTGGTVSFMEIADYDTEASATESVKWARNLGTSTGSISYAEQLAKNALIDQDVTVDSEPTFETVNVKSSWP